MTSGSAHMTSIVIRQLVPDDAPAAIEIRREALAAEPFAFSASPEDDRALSLPFVREALVNPSQATFGAFAPQLVGMVGVSPDAKRKRSHKAHVWGMYVSPSHRGLGLGRRLMLAALEHAARLPGVSEVQLGVAETAVAAVRLYTSLGFVAWGTEPRGIRVGEHFVALQHMLLALDDAHRSDLD
jgi:ribosomal protein S18 acetylase RimI-like enzyme